MSHFSRPEVLRSSLLVCVCSAALSAGARANDCETFGPMAPTFRTSQSDFYDQLWSEVAHTPNGFVFAWSEGQDILLRRYDSNLMGVSIDTLVNSTLDAGQQDEPAIVGGVTGNVFVAWSDRNSYDGNGMGVYGRVFDSNGAPLTPEIPINQTTFASQWRPLLAPTANGGFAVAWSGDSDGNAYFRLFTAMGAPSTSEIRVNQYSNDAQVDPALAVGVGGNVFVVFVDFSSHAGFSGTDLYGRIFNSAGTPLTNEFLIPLSSNFGDQRTPRIATDGQGHFNVVWQSELADGSGYGIVARRMDALGNGLAPEFVVNSTVFGDQIEPRIAMETDGDFIISWEDYSLGTSRAMCRRFYADGTAKDGETQIREGTLEPIRPEIWMSTSGNNIVFAYEVWNGTDSDVEARRFSETLAPQIYCTGKVNSGGCTPAIAYSGTASATSSSAFDISATNVFNLSPGMLFYGFSSSFMPFQGGTLCLTGVHRTQVQIAGGPTTGHTCTGTFHYDFNARIQSGVDPSLTVGRSVSAQYYARDLQDPAGFGTSLTNAVRFTICP